MLTTTSLIVHLPIVLADWLTDEAERHGCSIDTLVAAAVMWERHRRTTAQRQDAPTPAERGEQVAALAQTQGSTAGSLLARYAAIQDPGLRAAFGMALSAFADDDAGEPVAAPIVPAPQHHKKKRKGRRR